MAGYSFVPTTFVSDIQPGMKNSGPRVAATRGVDWENAESATN